MARKISVIIKEPGKKPYHTYISNTLPNLQKTVDGYIELMNLTTDSAIIVNEEGIIRDLPFNCVFCGRALYGTIVFVGIEGEEITDFPVEFSEFKRICAWLWDPHLAVI